MATTNKGEGLVSAGSSKFRAVLILLVILAFIIALYVYFFQIRTSKTVETGAIISAAKNINSIPGSEEATPEFVKLLTEENIRKAKEAEAKGESSIATVVRPTFKGASDFDSVGGAKKGCSIDELRRAKEAGVSSFELRCRGCPASALRAAGYSAGELAAAGFSAKELKDAGFTAKELRDAGFTAKDLKDAGYSVDELAKAGFTASELSTAGFTPDELRFAGFTKADLEAAGIGVGTPPNMPKDCDPEGLRKAHASGITAAQLRKLGCGAAALKAAGYTAQELRASGISAAQLKAAGFSATELKAAGFTAAELAKAGFTAKEIKDGGYTADQLKQAGFTAEELKAAGFTKEELQKAGFTEGELARAGYEAKPVQKDMELCDPATLKKMKERNVKLSAFKDLGCPDKAFTDAGFTTAEIAAITKAKQQCEPEMLKSMKARRAKAYEFNELGCSDTALATAGFSVAEIEAIARAKQLCEPGVLKSMKARNAAASEYNELGCSDTAFANAGFTAAEIDAIAKAKYGLASEEVSKLEAIRRQREAALTKQERQDELQKLKDNMKNTSQDLFGAWAPPAKQAYVEADEKKPTAGGTPGSEATSVSGQPSATTVAGKAGNTPELAPGTFIPIKAGNIMFAILDTGINSDEISPILATIVSGKLKGSKLVGNFSAEGKKVLLTFNLMGVPWLDTSLKVTAVAIDPDTARTALASNVDNHYMVRFGSLFASSFLSGFADAVSSSGSTTSATPAGVTTTMPILSTKDKFIVAIGKVGTEYSKVLGDSFKTKPTITVKAGSPVGLLFMNDTQVPLPTEAMEN